MRYPTCLAQPFKSLFRRKKWMVIIVLGYILLLVVSHGLRLKQPDPWLASDTLKSVELSSGADRKAFSGRTVIRYQDSQPDAPKILPVVLLIHGSPVAASKAFPELVNQLSGTGRILAPDLPGFGYSTRKIDDYGFTSHADYLLAFINELAIERVHIIAYSMGGGVAIHMATEHPERIASLSLVSSIGVQELELLGDYHLNHALHGLQFGAIWILETLTPHMGWIDRVALNSRYARNFYDADQRPLRNRLSRIEQPMLIIHGQSDRLVPLAAAREHHRLVPQSSLVSLKGGHLMLFGKTAEVARIISNHIANVELGKSVRKNNALPERLQMSQTPFGQIRLPEATGAQLLLYGVLIALATLVSEDLACIGAGMLAARGIIGYVPATLSAFTGIFIGDLLLFAAGRFIGRPALHRAPLRWIITDDDVTRATQWLNQNGPGVIFASRFLPGSRLPVYFTAGVLGGRLSAFLFYFCIAAAIWTPGLVGLSMWAGEALMAYYAAFERYAIWVVLLAMLLLWTIVRLCVPLLSFKGRRLLLSKYKRIRHWEFWPLWLLYLPVVSYILYLGFRHRHWTLFTAANPAIPGGGIVGESKSDILHALSPSNTVAPFTCIKSHWSLNRQMEEIRSFMSGRQIDFPVVCKPDAGERGKGVKIAATIDELHTYLQSAALDTIVQQFVSGDEFGVFYYRYPGHKRGHIFAITDKRLLTVTGDGQSSIEKLILKDSRAVCQAPLHLQVHRQRLHHIPPAGEKVQLVSVGTHCRGALFLDGSRLITPAMTRSFDRISRHLKGFYFGRYDVRTQNINAFKAGNHFKVLELNGVTSEATHIYDPSNTLPMAWRTLMQQWKIAFKIGALNQKKGAPTLSSAQFLKLVFLKGNRKEGIAATSGIKHRS